MESNTKWIRRKNQNQVNKLPGLMKLFARWRSDSMRDSRDAIVPWQLVIIRVNAALALQQPSRTECVVNFNPRTSTGYNAPSRRMIDSMRKSISNSSPPSIAKPWGKHKYWKHERLARSKYMKNQFGFRKYIYIFVREAFWILCCKFSVSCDCFDVKKKHLWSIVWRHNSQWNYIREGRTFPLVHKIVNTSS